ncbi:MAG: SGNH/GDSL hydrolase family protein [Planctomycetota bacterium]|nr:SGNH/GDSL hydrolase family protein [Planctomycetota bacterium]
MDRTGRGIGRFADRGLRRLGRTRPPPRDRTRRHAPAPRAARPPAGSPAPVCEAWLAARAPGAAPQDRAALANLVQLALLVQRDGDLLQELFRVYLALGLKASPAALGLPVDLPGLLRIGEDLAARVKPCPFDTGPVAWQAALQKVELWLQKHAGRDRYALAAELLREPGLAALKPALAARPARRVAVLGHSMTMSLHWTTHGSWIETACEVRRLLEPRFEYASFQAGGLTPARALREGLVERLLLWKPDEAYVLVFVGNASDRESLAEIVARMKAQDIRFHLVDDVRPWAFEGRDDQQEAHRFQRELCAREGGVFLDFQRRHAQAPDWESWRPVGGDIHMYTPGHLFYARELLKFWAG